MNAKSIMAAASTDALTPEAPTTANAKWDPACMSMDALAFVSTYTAWDHNFDGEPCSKSKTHSNLLHDFLKMGMTKS